MKYFGNFQYKRYFKGKIKTEKKNQKPSIGNFALIAYEPARLTIKQVESARRTIKKIVKPVGGLVKVKVRATKPVTLKPLAVRMGRGKGRVALHCCPVRLGSVLLEVLCLDVEYARRALKQGAYKLPLKSCILER